jgi:hypothetical protein
MKAKAYLTLYIYFRAVYISLQAPTTYFHSLLIIQPFFLSAAASYFNAEREAVPDPVYVSGQRWRRRVQPLG